MTKPCHKCQHENPDNTRFCGNCGENLPAEEANAAFTKTMETPVEELTTGSTFASRYQIIEELGKGGMGRVYKALDTKLNEKIAIKLIRPEIASDKKNIERFNNELKFARQISHRNVGRMYHLEEEKGRHYITMEYVTGEDLKSMIRMSGQLSIGTAINLAKQICEGLEEAHRLDVIHRDLKPNNIMIDKQGIARIMDFGIARSLKAKSMTGAGVMIGTPEYMAPEQVDGKEVDLRSDIYSVGIILYEMLTGRLPFEGETPFTIGIKQKSEKPEDPKNFNGNIPVDLSRLILKCLEKKPEIRYQTAGELHSDLSLLEQGVPTAERKISERKPLTSKEITVTIGVRKLILPIFAVVVLIATIVILLKVLPRGDSIPSLEGKPSVAILYFKNNTGDSALDHWREALANLLITDLAQSKYVNVLSEDKLFNILEELDQLDARNFSSEILREVASLGKVNHVLVGSFSRAGDVYRMNITLQKAAEGEISGSESVEGTGEQSFYTMVDELTLRIKSHFALSQEQLSSDIDRGVGEITTGNPEALKFYIQGRQLHLKANYRQSLQVMEKAIAIDPDFAMAYRSIAMSYNNLFLYAERAEYIQKAMSLSERLSERERYQITGDYYSDSESTYDNSIEAFSNLLKLYPDAVNAINNLANIYSAIGEKEKASEYYLEAIQRGDRSSVVYTNLAEVYQAIERYDQSKDLLESYIETVSDLPSIRERLCINYIHQGDLDLALAEAEKGFLLDPSYAGTFIQKGEIYRYKGDPAKAEAEFQKVRQQEEFRAQLGGTVWLMYLYLELGRLREGLDLMNWGREMVIKAGQAVWITRYHVGFSRFYSGTGQPQKALDEAEQALIIADNLKHFEFKRNAWHQKGLAQIGLGDVQAAEKTADELKEFIEAGMNKKIIHLYYHLKGEIELKKGNVSQAVDLLKQAIDLLDNGPLAIDVSYMNSLAHAYHQSGELDQAIIEYERIASLTIGRREQGYIWAKSFYMLGKIYEQLDNTAKGKEYYEKFLDLWKDADPGQPEVEDAKKRLAALKPSE
ncbi:protein kinase [Acidobacteriota bacterium]